MKNKILVSAILALTIVGCGNPPEPIQLDNDSAITINQELIRKESRQIPLDPFMKQNNWTYNLEFEKSSDGEYIPNDKIVKAFFVAHNADKIIIIGNKAIAKEYKTYLVKNGCKAENIAIHHIDSIVGSKKRVNILFFGMKGENNESLIKTFTNLFGF